MFVIFMLCMCVSLVLLLQIDWFKLGFYIMLFHVFWAFVWIIIDCRICLCERGKSQPTPVKGDQSETSQLIRKTT